MPWATSRRLRSLHDPEAADLAAVTLLLGRPAALDKLIAGEALVERSARHVSTADGRQVRVPEPARRLLRAGPAGPCFRRRGRPTLPRPTSPCGWRSPDAARA